MNVDFSSLDFLETLSEIIPNYCCAHYSEILAEGLKIKNEMVIVLFRGYYD